MGSQVSVFQSNGSGLPGSAGARGIEPQYTWPATCILFSHDLAPVPPAFRIGTPAVNHATRGAHTRGGTTARRWIARRTPTRAYGTAQTTALCASGRPRLSNSETEVSHYLPGAPLRLRPVLREHPWSSNTGEREGGPLLDPACRAV